MFGCVHCGKDETPLRCESCKNSVGQHVRYCSEQCRQRDWDLAHKHFCSLTLPTKEPDSVYCFLLAENESKPRVIQSKRYSMRDEFISGTQGLGYMTTNPLKDGHQRRMGDTLLFISRDSFLTDGSAPNNCIAALAGREAPHPWAGPVLVVKYRWQPSGVGEWSETEIDVQLSDGTDVVDYLKSYGG